MLTPACHLAYSVRSAPVLFNRLSDAIHWVLQHNYGVMHLLHYLDDFFTAGPANSSDCMNNLTAMLSLCNKIIAPVKSSKIEDLSTTLGILLDITTMEASICDAPIPILASVSKQIQRYQKNPVSLIESDIVTDTLTDTYLTSLN